MLYLSWLEAFCITSNHLEEEQDGKLVSRLNCTSLSFTLPASPPPVGRRSPRGVLLVFGLHHVAQAGVGESLREVRVRRHEAVVVEARPQAGGAEAEALALGAARPAQGAVALGGQVVEVAEGGGFVDGRRPGAVRRPACSQKEKKTSNDPSADASQRRGAGRAAHAPALISPLFFGLIGAALGSAASFSFPFLRMGLREGVLLREGRVA
ncbi:hypothetical protein EYF80_045564 [Liparis tanakae]|uniref:Uncharacterized protein n=1 Tax=Liparis tanakae TaxID=230148 RepID=A0A4Z2FSQ8_9TELE|nr:hypothetical protein EYF80_045564 [Liparis tanakae]